MIEEIKNFQNKIYKSKDLTSVSKEHDLKLLPILDVMLYGIASEENENIKNKGAKTYLYNSQFENSVS